MIVQGWTLIIFCMMSWIIILYVLKETRKAPFCVDLNPIRQFYDLYWAKFTNHLPTKICNKILNALKTANDFRRVCISISMSFAFYPLGQKIPPFFYFSLWRAYLYTQSTVDTIHLQQPTTYSLSHSEYKWPNKPYTSSMVFLFLLRTLNFHGRNFFL